MMRYINIENQICVPMKNFTQDDLQPSEQTLQIIRTIARYYPKVTMTVAEQSLCWN